MANALKKKKKARKQKCSWSALLSNENSFLGRDMESMAWEELGFLAQGRLSSGPVSTRQAFSFICASVMCSLPHLSLSQLQMSRKILGINMETIF